MKKVLSAILLVFVITASLAACSKFEYSNSTITAKITAINGQKVTLLVGMSESNGGMMPGGNTPPENGMRPGMPNGQESVPALPEGESMPAGGIPEMPVDGSAPEMPNESMQQPEGGMQGQIPDMPEGGMQGNMPGGGMGGMMPAFDENGDKITVTLNAETVSTLAVGDVVIISFGDDGSVTSLNVLGGNMQGGMNGNKPQMMPPESGSNS